MFKPLDEVLQPDPRYDNQVVREEDGRLRTIALADHHALIAAIDLPATAPPEVLSIFNRARHVLLYAWFDYELTPVAEQQALAALEVALRQRLAMDTSFRGLLERAVKDQLLPEHLGPVPLPEAITAQRNALAHGSANFAGPGPALEILRICADLIGALSARPRH